MMISSKCFGFPAEITWQDESAFCNDVGAITGAGAGAGAGVGVGAEVGAES